MNYKEEAIYKILQIVSECCSYRKKDGTLSVTPEDLISKDRIGDNVNLSRCILVRQMKVMGFTTETIADLIQRTESTIRDMIIKGGDMEVTSYAYKIASAEVTQKCKAIMSEL